MTPRSPLRDLTRAEHEAVDRLHTRFDLSQAAGYRAFLSAQASAFLAIEAALYSAGAADLVEDWPERRRSELLKADLAELGINPPRGQAPPLPFEADLLGGIYVLEGSRLGGAVLSSRHPAGAPSRFLAAPFLFASGHGEQARLPDQHQDVAVLQKPYTLENAARALDPLVATKA